MNRTDTPPHDRGEDKYSGVMAASLAFVFWGVLPIYWKLLKEVPALEILCHRTLWSVLVTLGLIVFLGRRRSLWRAVTNLKTVVTFTFIALLLAANWLIYIWAVNAGHIIEASLGYFINPLINVLFGVIFFGERMRFVQWCALFMVCCGVIYLTVYYGQFPWIALSLAVCFATYGLLHKKNSLPALEGFCLETIVLFIPAVLFLLIIEIKGNGSFGHVDLSQSLLLVGTGIVTAAPLLLFGYAASKIPLSTLGLVQYLAPTINLLIGIFMYGESFPRERMIGFMLIWVALLLYAAENTVRRIRVGRKVL
jgi:chloramphenicol-sensitive protein RarD